MSRNHISPNGEPNKQPIPWLWLGLGIMVTIIGCVAAWMLVSSWLLRPPQETANPQEPLLIVLTAPPSPTPAPTSSAAAPTPIPTFTPSPTPDTAVAPEAITPGY